MPLSGRRIFGLRSGCSRYDGNSDQYDRSNNHPSLRNADENRRDRQADDENDESDQVSAERGHDFFLGSIFGGESSKKTASYSELRAAN
jgi:hypothetical protein